eukprot:TRINITY_DN2208_c0_g1_i1.p1 TRINITY_DN2208_c0_g1~~TRINITY_DN2208_c0_g1_i1.p1  ORF type:complete len:213 (+),score=83.26 TRINITY_DN2208_c0_g1_i1:171-809(+)
MSIDYDILLKVVVIGDSGVGKSCMLHRYTEDTYEPDYIATIGVDFKVDTFERQGKVVKLQLWDTAGQERFRTIITTYYRSAHCVMLCYDVTDRETFAHLQRWVKEVEEYARDNIPFVLVGLKADLPKHVSTEEALEYAEAYGMKHVEVSSKEGLNVHDAVQTAVSSCLGSREEELQVETDERKKRLQMHQAHNVHSPSRMTCLQRAAKLFGI